MEDISKIGIGNEVREIEDTEARAKASEAYEIALAAEAKVDSVVEQNTNFIPKEGDGVRVTAVNNFANGFQINGVPVYYDAVKNVVNFGS